jgi:hypothetical protein
MGAMFQMRVETAALAICEIPNFEYFHVQQVVACLGF